MPACKPYKAKGCKATKSELRALQQHCRKRHSRKKFKKIDKNSPPPFPPTQTSGNAWCYIQPSGDAATQWPAQGTVNAVISFTTIGRLLVKEAVDVPFPPQLQENLMDQQHKHGDLGLEGGIHQRTADVRGLEHRPDISGRDSFGVAAQLRVCGMRTGRGDPRGPDASATPVFLCAHREVATITDRKSRSAHRPAPALCCHVGLFEWLFASALRGEAAVEDGSIEEGQGYRGGGGVSLPDMYAYATYMCMRIRIYAHMHIVCRLCIHVDTCIVCRHFA